MEETWNHDRPYYRCQVRRDHPANSPDHPATIYVREDSIVPRLDSWVAELFTDDHLDDKAKVYAEIGIKATVTGSPLSRCSRRCSASNR
jgi:hypothetical protein